VKGLRVGGRCKDTEPDGRRDKRQEGRRKEKKRRTRSWLGELLERRPALSSIVVCVGGSRVVGGLFICFLFLRELLCKALPSYPNFKRLGVYDSSGILW